MLLDDDMDTLLIDEEAKDSSILDLLDDEPKVLQDQSNQDSLRQ